jgi:hypothetical protein|nr:MAG TPA: 43 kDa tail protein [Caudoviricetes sp.]
MFENGSTVIFTYSGANLFYGWLFKSVQNKKTIKCTCYDQLRYLKAKSTLIREIETLDSFVNRVTYHIGEKSQSLSRMRLGEVDSTEYMLPKYFYDNQTYLDMLYSSIQDNLRGNGYYYTLRDNFGALDLRDTVDLRLPLVIGDNSIATDFEYTRSIEDAYNRIKVAKDDKQSGVRNAYMVQDSAAIAKWGPLTLYEKVSADYNEVQLAQLANLLLKIKNKETETLKAECIGDTRVMGGSGVKVEIRAANLNTWAIVSSVTHEFKKTAHTMEMNLIFGRW